jgi:hypothetical protein
MHCPKCKADFSRIVVMETRECSNYVRRRRKCLDCGHRFTTIEIEPALAMKPGNNFTDYALVDKHELNRIKLFISRQVKYTLNLAEQLKIDL